MTESKHKMPEALKEIVLWKLDTMPPHMKLSIGNKGTFSKEELKSHIEKEDEIGIIFSQMQLNFMKALASGEFSKAIAK